MIVQFNLSDKYHLKEVSHYNHNYYILPYPVGDCTVVYEECIDDDNSPIFQLGNFDENEKFEARFEFWGDMDGNVDLINNKIN